MLGHSLMYFVKFSDALREKFMNCEDRGFKTRSFSQLARRYPSRLCLLSRSSHQLDSRMSDEAKKKKNRRKRKQRTSSGYRSVLSVQSVVS